MGPGQDPFSSSCEDGSTSSADADGNLRPRQGWQKNPHAASLAAGQLGAHLSRYAAAGCGSNTQCPRTMPRKTHVHGAMHGNEGAEPYSHILTHHRRTRSSDLGDMLKWSSVGKLIMVEWRSAALYRYICGSSALRTRDERPTSHVRSQ